MSLRERIAGALVSQAPGAEWGAGGVDRSLELADIFISAGITDLTKLSVTIIEYDVGVYDPNLVSDNASQCVPIFGDCPTVPGPGGYVLGKEKRLAFSYKGIIKDWLNDPDYPNKFFEGTRFAWSAAGDGNVSYHVVFDSKGFSIQPFWGSSSDWGDFREALKFTGTAFLAVAALPAVGFSAGSYLGAAIVGETVAVAYPALTASIGNVALSTALNGGDVETAVKRTALSFAGSQAGGLVSAGVTGATGLDTLGKVAGSVAASFVTGADPITAATFTLLSQVPNMSLQSSAPEFYDLVGDAPDFMPIPDIPGNFDVAFDGGFDSGSITADPGFTGLPVYNWNGADAGWVQPVDSDLPLIDYSTPPAPASLFPVPGIAPGFENIFASTQNVIGVVTQAAASALQLVRAYQQTKAPVQTAVRRVTSGGVVEIAARDGFIHTQAPNGKTTKKMPRAGEAYATADSSLIVNNGDGTFTTISPNGAQSVTRYPSTGFNFAGVGAGLDTETTIRYGLLAVGAFFLLRKVVK